MKAILFWLSKTYKGAIVYSIFCHVCWIRIFHIIRSAYVE